MNFRGVFVHFDEEFFRHFAQKDIEKIFLVQAASLFVQIAQKKNGVPATLYFP